MTCSGPSTKRGGDRTLARTFNPIGAVALKDLRTVLTSRRILIASVVAGFVLLLAAWGFAQTAGGAPEGGDGVLWERGADGALAALLFAVVPIVLPLLPVVVAYDTLTRDRDTGMLDLYLTQPSPKPSIAAGKVLGTLGGLAAIVVPLNLAGTLLIRGIVGGAFEPGLQVAFVGFGLLLAFLYLLLTLGLGSATTPSTGAALAFLAWAGFNALRPTAALLFGQMIGLLPVEEAVVFTPTGADLVSFTGLYEILLAGFLPTGLGIVMGPEPGSPWAWTPAAAPWVALLWLVLLGFLFALRMGHVPRR